MRGLVLRRLGQLVLAVLGITTMVFFLVRLSGDPATVLAGADATPEDVERIRATLGLDAPLPVQYGKFLLSLVQLDFGESFLYRTPAFGVVMERLPASMLLAVAAAVVSIAVAVPAGIHAATHRRGLGGRSIMAGTMVGQAMPGFVLGIVLILVFSVQLGWFSSLGLEGPASLVLPTLTLASTMMARQTRLIRSYTIDELNRGYVRTARALGYRDGRIRYRHVLRNITVPVVALLGIELGHFLGGAVVTEAIFAWPGLGRLMVEAVAARDYPVIQAGVFTIGVMVVVLNFVIDLLYRVIDPRLKAGAA